MPAGFDASLAVEHQQLAQGVVVADVGRPAVGGRDGGVERRMRVHEPLRSVVVEVRQRALPERLRSVLVSGHGTPRVTGSRLVHPVDPLGRIEPPVARLDETPGGIGDGDRSRVGRVAGGRDVRRQAGRERERLERRARRVARVVALPEPCAEPERPELVERFARAVVDETRNARAAPRLAEERSYLRPLPPARIPEYTTFRCVVRKWSTIRVGGRVYSVPSRLIGHTVEARQHPSTVEVLYGGRVLCTMARLRGSAEHRIDYRHIIASLVRKPGAFARYRFREELFPSLVFRAAYDALGRTHGERADVEYVRLLHLAATTGERRVEATLRARLDAGDPCDYASVQAQVRPPATTVPMVRVPQPNLAQYDALLTGGLHG